MNPNLIINPKKHYKPPSKTSKQISKPQTFKVGSFGKILSLRNGIEEKAHGFGCRVLGFGERDKGTGEWGAGKGDRTSGLELQL